MSSFSVTDTSSRTKRIAGTLVIVYALITMLPLVWIGATGFKSPADAISYPPKVVFSPTLEGYVNLFTTRTRQTQEYLQNNPPTNWADEIVRQYDMVIVGPSKFGERFLNSVIIGFGSTFLSIFLGTLAAYAFSRFKIPLADDLLFFILSTRMMPPIAVAIPIFLMYRNLGLSDTHLGMILLYTAVNISLAVWLLKGFIDEIPREYEEAALIDGYTRFPGLLQGRASAGSYRNCIHRHLLPDLRLERICLCGSADFGNRPDCAAVHSHDNRYWRFGLARRRCRSDPVPAAGDDFHNHAAQTSAAWNYIWSGSQMTGFIRGVFRFRRGPWENVGHDSNCAGCLYADATVYDVGLHLLIHNNSRWHGDVYHRQSFSGVIMAEIIIKNIRKQFGDFVAVQESSFTVEDGEFFMLLGPSGCGKTTTLRMIAGLELPTSGEIFLDGEEISQRPPSARDIAFVFQMFALYPHLNVRKNISYPLVSQGMSKSKIKDKVSEVAGILGIEDILNRPVGGLSGG